jgi:NDP-sugar pyrophosphorylase family protein
MSLPHTSTLQGASKGLKAVILAGGKGTRLMPFTVNFPKPLVPLGDTPVLEVLLQRLIRYGITDVTLTLGHLAELIRAYFDHRHKLVKRLNLSYVQEERLVRSPWYQVWRVLFW